MAAHVIAAPGRGDPYRPLLAAATLLSLCVVGLGAYVRLTDAGLGCPDWPGCYGHLLVPDGAADPARAWHEMIHRYAAGGLGVLVVALSLAAWLRPGARGGRPWLESGLCGLVVFQAVLGMWTVTELLKPVIVTAHLLGGMLLWTLLAVLCRREFAATGPGRRRGWGSAALAAALFQVALGGWVSSHYAGLACPDLPACPGGWWPDGAGAAIQWSHRLGAMAVLAVVGTYAIILARTADQRRLGLAIGAALLMQLALGLANVWLQLPLPLAVAHNLGAALLLATIAASLAGRRR